mmetsp:Transcript_48995/g.137161  ORF Transcript_48995/g.137161 Transcript_48995/m.137161 type:complete len:223 (-) Transcript_48995:195-863(-)
MASRGTFLPIAFLAIAALVAVRLLTAPQADEVAFVPPSLRGASAGALAAAVMAGSLAGPGPATAAETKYGFFGFGEGISDAYNQIDADQPNPYNMFSNPKDRMFKADDEVYMNRKRVDLDESFKRFLKTPGFIKTKQTTEITSLLKLQLGTMRANMEYITAGGPQFYRNDDESTPPFKMANAFFQDVADIGAAAKAKNWPRAQEKYEAATLKLAEWKRLVNY